MDSQAPDQLWTEQWICFQQLLKDYFKHRARLLGPPMKKLKHDLQILIIKRMI